MERPLFFCHCCLHKNKKKLQYRSIIRYKLYSVKRGLNAFAKSIVHVSLRRLRRLTWADTFRCLSMFCISKDHSSPKIKGSFYPMNQKIILPHESKDHSTPPHPNQNIVLSHDSEDIFYPMNQNFAIP